MGSVRSEQNAISRGVQQIPRGSNARGRILNQLPHLSFEQCILKADVDMGAIEVERKDCETQDARDVDDIHVISNSLSMPIRLCR